MKIYVCVCAIINRDDFQTFSCEGGPRPESLALPNEDSNFPGVKHTFTSYDSHSDVQSTVFKCVSSDLGRVMGVACLRIRRCP